MKLINLFSFVVSASLFIVTGLASCFRAPTNTEHDPAELDNKFGTRPEKVNLPNNEVQEDRILKWDPLATHPYLLELFQIEKLLTNADILGETVAGIEKARGSKAKEVEIAQRARKFFKSDEIHAIFKRLDKNKQRDAAKVIYRALVKHLGSGLTARWLHLPQKMFGGRASKYAKSVAEAQIDDWLHNHLTTDQTDALLLEAGAITKPLNSKIKSRIYRYLPWYYFYHG
uniref:RxLR effector candidate protein n=1 Tax=Hyaloperonospora arabidopsidis (strain Emoy2) TaxID=559515 RepID=M4BK51_HYAAE